MKKELLTAALFLGTLAASAQVGIGTLTPNKSAQLDVEATDKGILIPRVSLQSITDATTITNGNVNSLLVFNTNTQNDVAPGYYYWYEDKWLRIVNNDDLVALDQNTKNVLLSVVGDELVLQDSDNDTVTVPLSQINILTNIVDNNDGTFTYTNEAGTAVTISIPASVINNIQTILGDTNVLNELIEVLGDTYVGGNVYYDGTQFTYVDQSGATHIINFEDIVQANETVTTIVKNTDGTYTYTNEADATFVIDVPTSVVEQFENIYNQIVNEEIVVNGDTYNTFEEYLTHIVNEAVTINGGDMITVTGTGTATDPYMVNIDKGTANSMLITNAAGELEWATIEDIVQANETVTTIVKNTDGTYTYTNEADATFIIDVPASVVEQFENIYNQIVNEEIVVNGDTYNTFEEYLTHIANEAVTINGGDMITVTGTGTATDPYMVNIDKGTANSMLITNAAGELEWATIEDIVQANETVTTIVKNTDGTYTYTNEADATFIIDVPASVVEQFENIYNQIVNEEIVVNGNTYNTFEEYLTHIANEAVTINGGDMITVTGTGTATDPYMVNIDKGTANSMLITNAAGELEWATIEDIVQANETVTTIVKNTDGTYTYTNEADATFVIDVPASVVEQFENIYNQIVNEEIVVNGDTYNTFEEYLTHIANEAVTINGGDMITVTGTGTATDPYIVNIDKGTANSMLITNAAGELEWATIEDIVQANETVTTIVKNTDGTYTYTNEADVTFVIDVPASVVEQFENIYNQIVNEEIVVNGDTYNTFEEYLTHIANEAVTINGGDMITVTGTGTATDPYIVNIDKGTANSMLITNAAGELEWASIEDIVQGVQKTVTIIDGMNTTVDANVSGNNTEYKVNVATAKGADGTTAANLGVVKEAMVNPSVSVSQAGELSVNLESLNAIKEVNVSYNAILDDAILLGNANTGDITITLPDAVGNKGKKFTIKKQDSNEDYYVNVVGSINGLSQLYTALPHSGWELVSDGTTWKITNKF